MLIPLLKIIKGKRTEFNLITILYTSFKDLRDFDGKMASPGFFPKTGNPCYTTGEYHLYALMKGSCYE